MLLKHGPRITPLVVDLVALGAFAPVGTQGTASRLTTACPTLPQTCKRDRKLCTYMGVICVILIKR